MLLSIITINYNSQKPLSQMIESVSQWIDPEKYPYEILIGNNDLQPLKIPFPPHISHRIIENKKNLGFGNAINQIAPLAQGDWLLLLNPDVFLTQPLAPLFEYFQKNPSIGAIGPKIILTANKKSQPWTCGKKTSLSKIIFKQFNSKPWNKNSLTEVDWISGAALLIKKKDFLELEGFDKNFFMYFEDQDLCLRLQQKNKKIIFYPAVSINHLDGQSWGNHTSQKTHFYRSQDYFFSKHYGPFKTMLLKTIRKPLEMWTTLR